MAAAAAGILRELIGWRDDDVEVPWHFSTVRHSSTVRRLLVLCCRSEMCAMLLGATPKRPLSVERLAWLGTGGRLISRCEVSALVSFDWLVV